MTEPPRSPAPVQRVTSLPGELLAGAGYPLRALGMLRRSPQLWPNVLAPIGVNLLLGALLYAGLWFTGMRAIDNLMAGLPEWSIVLEVFLRGFLTVALLRGIGFVLLRFGVVLGSPWYSKLSEQIEQIYLGRPAAEEQTSFGTALRDVGAALAFEIKKLLLFVGLGALLLLLGLVPVLGPPAAMVGWFALGATIICLDFFDSSLARRRLRFRAKLGLIRRHLPATAGFGLLCLGLVSIPFLNLFAIPLCVAAGTLFFCERIWPRLREERRRVT